MKCLLCEGDINFKKYIKHCCGCDNIICHICSEKVSNFCPFCRGDYYVIPINYKDLIKSTKHKNILLNKIGIFLVQKEKYEDAREYFIQSSLEIAEDNIIFLYNLGLLKSPIRDKKVDFFNYYLNKDSICYLENASIKWLEILSEYGYHHAQYKLAKHNWNGKINEKRLTLIYEAIENGSSKACIFLYDIDRRNNIYWLKKAAKMNDTGAMLRLYHIDKNIEHLYKALYLGEGDGAFFLGHYFLRKENLNQTYHFFEKATLLGHKYAGDCLITIKEILLEPIEE